MRFLLRLLVIVVVAGIGLAVAVVALLPEARALVSASESDYSQLDLDALPERSLMFAGDGSLVASLHAEENRSPVALADVPQPVIDTILAVEDEDFYAHNGVNLRSTIRALLENVEAGSIEQGGSTITQQVVKNSLLTPDRDLDRKTAEAVLALRLEEVMTKDEILERYLNSVYLGNGAYGVQAGAELYFGRGVAEIGYAEAALLAALIRNPEGYNPFRSPEQALERRRLSFDRLVETGHITEPEARWIDAANPLPTEPFRVIPPPNDYFVEEVKQQLLDDERLGSTASERYNAVFRGGLRIYTTFDPRAQEAALRARDERLPDSDGQFTNALASVEPTTGAVRAMVGGPGFENFRYNLATQGLRQTGSSFKIFVLIALLENGYVPEDSVNGGGPCRFPNPGGTPDPYVAENFEGGGGGVGSITSQTLRSSNCAFLRLGQIVGLQQVIDVARRMGVTSPLDTQLSLPIGAFEVSPLEMASAAAAIANDGMRFAPYYVERIEDRDGNVLFQHEPAGERVMSSQTARLAAMVLQQNVQSGTGTRARLPGGRPAAGKTGTAQDSADAWFVGFTPQLSTAVWMGAPVGRVAMRGVGGVRAVTGGSFPAMIWGQFMADYHADLPVMGFAGPDPTRPSQYLRLPGEPDIRRPQRYVVRDPRGTTPQRPQVVIPSMPSPVIPTRPVRPVLPPGFDD